MESSTEAMDTNEGQRTTARLLKEARHLLESTMEPTYATIDGPTTAMVGGSEAVMSDILATQDPRELTLSEGGERRPASSEMRAGLPTGSFSPFDFDKEFQTRHGVRPEDADKPYHSHHSSRESSIAAVPSGQETKPQLAEVSSPTSPTRGLGIIRTPGVAREQEYAERGTYAENILTFDTRLLQDIISGRWTRQQLYGSTPSWYRDSFYNITQPWDNRPGGYETPFGNQRPALTYDYQPQPFPMGPPSDVSSTTEPPSMVGPSVSIVEHPSHKKKVDFSVSHYARDEEHPDIKDKSLTVQSEDRQKVRTSVETIMASTTSPMRIASSLRQPEQITGRPTVTPRSTIPLTTIGDPRAHEATLRTDGGGQMYDVTSLEVQNMDITIPEQDIYHGVYPDFQLPLPNRPHISDLFAGNTRLVSNTNSPMSILHIPSLKKMYGTTEFAIDRNTGQLYTIRDIDVTSINLFGGIPDEELDGQITESTLVPLKTPQAMSTPVTEVPKSLENATVPPDSVPLPTPRIPIRHQEEETWTSSSTLSDPRCQCHILM